MKLFSQKGSLREIVVPAEKKISTPAGQRLSHIMDTRAPPIPPRSVLRNKNLHDVEESSTSSVLGGKGGFYSNAWSEGGVFKKDAKLEALRNSRHIAKRGGWWRLLLIVAIIIAAILALALGLVFGLRKTKSDSSSSNSSSAQADSSNNNQNNDSNRNSSGSGSNSSTTTSADFPRGTYSFTTFLDTVTTDCASNDATWTCPPYVIYNSNKQKSAATFDWIITGSEGNYKISSSDNPLALEFEDVDLVLYSEGQDSERYHFQFTMDKEVVPSTSITDDDSSSVCYFNSTIFTGYLYTKMEKDYPASDEESNNPWPYAVRAEQSIGGGENVPNCYKTVNGRITEQITDGIEAMGASTLCSCLYRNYLTK